MGEHEVQAGVDPELRARFTRRLLAEISALEYMLSSDCFERGVHRIGAEQELFLVDRSLGPAPVGHRICESIGDRRFATELGRYNLEANLTPRSFGGRCLSELEHELEEVLGRARRQARQHGADIALTGILPTLQKSDLGLHNMTPASRYAELNRAVFADGGALEVHIKGLDELHTSQSNVMLESANTSFQIHLQVHPDDFATYYNAAQVVSAPVLAAAVNSPILLRHRLWSETRIALFERSIDDRSAAHQRRGRPPRVHFGDGWVRSSVLEIFREDIARFRVMVSRESGEDPMAVLMRGEPPRLSALQLHNGTVYRWNRPCYGITGGVPHLRIENRVLPAGPTVVDEVANAAFFWGLLWYLVHERPRIDSLMTFDSAKSNFFAAARHGLEAQITWIDGHSHAAPDLVLNELLPQARQGLLDAGLESEDVGRYLTVVEERVRSRRTGARWMLESLAAMRGQRTPELRLRALMTAMVDGQHRGKPVHEWPLAKPPSTPRDCRDSFRTVDQIMSTDLFTVRPDDVVDLAASVMDWRRVRHVPVESEDGRLVGLIGHWSLLRLVGHGRAGPVKAAEIMCRDVITVTPEMRSLDAMRLMQEQHISCLPVVEGDRLVGIVTERDLVHVARALLEEYLEG